MQRDIILPSSFLRPVFSMDLRIARNPPLLQSFHRSFVRASVPWYAKPACVFRDGQ